MLQVCSPILFWALCSFQRQFCEPTYQYIWTKNSELSWSEGQNRYLLIAPFATMQHALESRLRYHDIPCIPHEISDFVNVFCGPYIEPFEDFLTSINRCLWRHASSCATVNVRGRPCIRLLGGLMVPLSIMLFLNRRTVRVVHRLRFAIISCGMLSSRPCLMLSVRSLSNLIGIPTIWAIRDLENGPERWERRENVESMNNSRQFGIWGGADKSFDLNCNNFGLKSTKKKRISSKGNLMWRTERV